MIERKTAEKILKAYGKAWVSQDVNKILSIFAEDGIYQERAFEKPFAGHRQIRNYWQKKVVEDQSDIKFRLLNFYVDGNTVIAEWEASFYSNAEKARIRIKEVAILEIESNKIKSLREYWQSERLS